MSSLDRPKLRQLTTDDMFLLSEAFDAMDLTFDPTGKTQEQVGAELAMLIARRLHRAKEPVKMLLASLVDRQIDEIGRMSPSKVVGLIVELVKQDGLLDFFKSAVQ